MSTSQQFSMWLTPLWDGCVRMHYTPGQLREAVGLSREAFRHWRQVLPGFARGSSHGPRFSPGDVLASAVLQCLTQSCGIRIGRLRTVSSGIFDVCNKTPWDVLADRTLVVDLGRQACSIVPSTDRMSGDSPVVVCPLEPVIAMLRDDLVQSSPVAAGRAGAQDVEFSGLAAAGGRHR